MKVLVSGNQGYIGTVLTKMLTENGFDVVGLDIGYFRDCNLTPIAGEVQTISRDVRYVQSQDISGVESVVHLAALSNDPLGEIDESLTFEINFEATLRLAKLSKSAGVRRFIFFSTQSIYGIAKDSIELDEYSSAKDPKTAYAASKWQAENQLLDLASKTFEVVIVRPSTVFGWSPRLRADIVFNNMIINGLYNNLVKVHSDGTPWRPVVHIDDVCRFVLLLLTAHSGSVASKAFNLGLHDGNFQVSQIAQVAADCLGIPGKIIFSTEEISDPRTYKVSFSRAREELGFIAGVTLHEGGTILVNMLQTLELSSDEIMLRCTRLAQLKQSMMRGTIDNRLCRVE